MNIEQSNGVKLILRSKYAKTNTYCTFAFLFQVANIAFYGKISTCLFS